MARIIFGEIGNFSVPGWSTTVRLGIDWSYNRIGIQIIDIYWYVLASLPSKLSIKRFMNLVCVHVSFSARLHNPAQHIWVAFYLFCFSALHFHKFHFAPKTRQGISNAVLYISSFMAVFEITKRWMGASVFECVWFICHFVASNNKLSKQNNEFKTLWASRYMAIV